MLNDRITTYGTRSHVDKSKFVDLLCEIWHDGIKPNNAISGSSSTGIWPVNREKYPLRRFDTRMLKLVSAIFF